DDRFPFAAHDHIDLGMVDQNLRGVIRWVDTAVDSDEIGKQRLERSDGPHASRVGRCGPTCEIIAMSAPKAATRRAISTSAIRSRAASRSMRVHRPRSAPPIISKPRGI